jgi:predicted RNA-binding protein YlxR (DUF448 family)
VARAPIRTCVGCGRRAERRELVRVVAGPNGTAVVDREARLPGRGAWLCGKACAPAAARGRLAMALRARLHVDAETLVRALGETEI